MSSAPIIDGKLCLISLADHFRRGVSAQGNADRLICKAAHDLVGNASYMYPEIKNMAENDQVARSLKQRMYIISGLVSDAYPDVSDIIIPIYKKTPIAEAIRDRVDMASIRDGFNFHFQTRQYTRSLSKLGAVQPELQALTSWAGGYRGLANISNKLVLQSSTFDRSIP